MKTYARRGWAMVVVVLALLLLAAGGIAFFVLGTSVSGPVPAASAPASPGAGASAPQRVAATPRASDTELVAPEPPAADPVEEDESEPAPKPTPEMEQMRQAGSFGGAQDQDQADHDHDQAQKGAYAGPGDGGSTSAPVATQTGSIRGRVFFDGSPPAARFHSVAADEAEGCPGFVPDEDGETGRIPDTRLALDANRGIANVIVSLDLDGGALPPPTTVSLTRRNCAFEPRIQVVNPGTRVRFENADSVEHSLLVLSKRNASLEMPLVAGATFDQIYSEPERIEVQCGEQDWQSAWVVVAGSAHTVLTGADGRFLLRGLPAGRYSLQLWHETLGEATREVTVEAGKTISLETSLGP